MQNEKDLYHNLLNRLSEKEKKDLDQGKKISVAHKEETHDKLLQEFKKLLEHVVNSANDDRPALRKG